MNALNCEELRRLLERALPFVEIRTRVNGDADACLLDMLAALDIDLEEYLKIRRPADAAAKRKG